MVYNNKNNAHHSAVCLSCTKSWSGHFCLLMPSACHWGEIFSSHFTGGNQEVLRAQPLLRIQACSSGIPTRSPWMSAGFLLPQASYQLSRGQANCYRLTKRPLWGTTYPRHEHPTAKPGDSDLAELLRPETIARIVSNDLRRLAPDLRTSTFRTGRVGGGSRGEHRPSSFSSFS